jgi:hypothetical protein
LKILNRRALKRDDVSRIEDLSVKEPRIRVELYVSGVSLVLQHRVTPSVQTLLRSGIAEPISMLLDQ